MATTTEVVNSAVQIMNGVLYLLNASGEIVDSYQNLRSDRRIGRQHNLVMGRPKVEDELLYEEEIQMSYSFPAPYQTHVFEYQCKNNLEIITCVVIQDGRNDDTGGNPEKIEGGPGKRKVKIRVTSKFCHGMKFSFYVYGCRQ